MITDFVSACGRSAVQPTVTPATGARRNRMRPAVDGASAKRWANVEAIRQMRTARWPPAVAVARAHRHEGGEGEIEYEIVEQAESVGAVAEGRQAVHDARQAPVGMPGKPSNALHRKPAIATGGSGGGSGRPLRHQYRRRLPPPGTRTEAYGSAPRRTILFPDDEKPTEDMAPTNGFVVRGWRNAIGTISSKTRPRLHSVIPSQGIRPDEHQDKDANTPKGVMS